MPPLRTLGLTSTARAGPGALGPGVSGGGELEQEPGLLLRIARTLDIPRSFVTELIAEDMLGLQLDEQNSFASLIEAVAPGVFEQNEGELDLVDVLGFIGEVATDPVNLLGGIGTLNRGGRAAKRLAQSTVEENAARAGASKATQNIKQIIRAGKDEGMSFADLRAQPVTGRQIDDLLKEQRAFRTQTGAAHTDVLKQRARLDELGIEGSQRVFGDTFAEQVKRGQRAGLTFRVPFTNPESGLELFNNSSILGLLGRAGGRIMDSNIAKLVSPAASKTAASQPLIQARSQSLAGDAARAGMLQADFDKMVDEISENLGKPREQVIDELGDVAHGDEVFKAKGDKDAADLLATMEPIEQQAAREMKLTRESLLGIMVHSGATRGATIEEAGLADDLIEYVERIMTPEAKKLKAKDAPLNEAIRAKATFIAHKAKEAPMRVDELRELTIREINELMSQKSGDEVGKWFVDDFTESLPLKQLGDSRSATNALYTQSFMDQFAVPHVPGQTAPLAEVAREGGVMRYRGVEMFGGNVADAQARITAKTGQELGVPIDQAKEWLALTGKFSAPEEWNKLVGVYDKYIKYMKFGLTQPFPSFHVRNLFTNITLNWMGDVSNPKFYQEAARILKAGAKDESDEAFQLMNRIGVARGGWSRQILREISGEGDVVETMLQKLARGGKGKLEKGVEAASKGVKGVTGKSLGEWSAFAEDVSRIAHYFGRRAKGDTQFQAIESVNKFLLDFGDLTQAERQIGRRAFLFYNWTRKMIPLMMRQFAENPARMAKLTRATVQPTIERPEFLPEFVRASAAIPGGVDADGNPTFIFGVGSPLEELNKLDPSTAEPGVSGFLKEAGRRVVSQMAPGPRTVAELLSGEDFFLRKPIEEADRAPRLFFGAERALPGFREDTLPSGAVRGRANPDVLFGLRQTPVSRAIAETSRLLDPRKPFLDMKQPLSSKAIHMLTGVRATSVDLEREVPRAKLREVNKRLSKFVGDGDVRTFKKLFATDEGKENPEVVNLMEILRGLEAEQKAKKRAAERLQIP